MFEKGIIFVSDPSNTKGKMMFYDEFTNVNGNVCDSSTYIQLRAAILQKNVQFVLLLLLLFLSSFVVWFCMYTMLVYVCYIKTLRRCEETPASDADAFTRLQSK